MKTDRELDAALAALTLDERRSLPPDVLAELATGRPRSLGQIVAGMGDVQKIAGGDVRSARVQAEISNLLVTTSGLGSTGTSVPHPGLMDAPLLAAFAGVDSSDLAVKPFTVEFTSTAAEVAEGGEVPESTLTYTPGAIRTLEAVSHVIPVTKQALDHNATLRADVDQFLSGGVIVKLEAMVAAELAAATGLVAHAFDTNLATTVRKAIAAAQGAMRELGPGKVTVALSPLDHAALDLSGFDLSLWPASIVSSPALPDGTAYVGRLGLAGQVFASSVRVTVGYITNQFVNGKLSVMAYVDALAHIAAPAAIVKADLTA